jgi:hypothetical protein
MAFTTLSSLVSTITGMTISGVTNKYAYRPRRVNATMLPILYTRLPTRKNDTSTLGYAQGLRVATIEIVILTALSNLDVAPNNDALALTLTDALADALESNAAALGMDSFEIAPDEDTIGDGTTPVQAIIATVEVSG